MATILLVTNVHPTEPFAASVAKKTAEYLRAKGHKVKIIKIPFKLTNIGKVLNAQEPLEAREFENGAEINELIRGEAKKVGAKAVFDFHTSPEYANEFWGGKGPYDFNIELRTRNKKTGVSKYCVEVRAVYQDLPDKLKKRIQKNSANSLRNSWNARNYLYDTTQHRKSVEAGFDPKKLAIGIGGVIHTQFKPKARKIPLAGIWGRMPRRIKKHRRH